MKRTEVAQLWERVSAGQIYGLMEGDSFYLEPSFSEDKMEMVVRLFLAQEEAEEYGRQMFESDCVDPEKARVEQVCLDELFKQRESLYQLSKREYDCKFRMELCSCESDSRPITKDVLWDFNTRLN